MAPLLIACPGCGCHVKASETDCRVCGAALRKSDGTVPRTAAAVLLGLATSTLACSPAIESQGSDAAAGSGGAHASSTGDVSTTSSVVSTGTSSSSGIVTEYGPAPTTGVAGGGQGGVGGQGGAGGQGGQGGLGGAGGGGLGGDASSTTTVAPYAAAPTTSGSGGNPRQ